MAGQIVSRAKVITCGVLVDTCSSETIALENQALRSPFEQFEHVSSFTFLIYTVHLSKL